ncbi:phage holin family protein [Clostridium estertheticum]|uniref:phage holin family protein n=1 Tax=Clostridium estertheticum TaxID=238834 RepID=UPI0013EEE1C0|nr:phage holin family protein [Clostridium estertheticum]MBZ9608622.1 phage holin family protein [Clostridium estertheticum]
MNEKEIFNTTVAILGGILTYILGGWDTCLIVLVSFIFLDYMTGVWGAFIQKKISSDTGRRGILKKATILVVLIVAVLLDRLINNGTWVFRTLVCYFYIANEGISLLENAVKIGVPVPKKLLDTLEQLKK